MFISLSNANVTVQIKIPYQRLKKKVYIKLFLTMVFNKLLLSYAHTNTCNKKKKKSYGGGLTSNSLKNKKCDHGLL